MSARRQTVNEPVRSSGVQLHITSLPSGRLGPEAYRFVDWLAEAGQRWWQMLPLGPPDRYRSPYKSSSAFAAWPGLIWDRRAVVRASEVIDFRNRHGFWLPSWEAYSRRGAVLDQVRFAREWERLRAYAGAAGVRLLGDVAIYVSPGGADERYWPSLFTSGQVAGAPPDAYSDVGQLWGNPLYDWGELRRQGYVWWVQRIRRTLELFDMARIDHFRGFVSYWAVPAGARTAVEGRWRRGPGAALFAAIERGLGSGVGAAGASGAGAAGVGAAGLLNSIHPPDRIQHSSRWTGPLTVPLVAEDLGSITGPVERLRRSLAMPGMLVIQFGMDPRAPSSPHRLENHTADRIVYTATHDQDTTRGWLEGLTPARRAFVDAEVSRHGFADPGEPWWGVIRLVFSSPARVAMIQAQDVLGLGSQARMNVPGSAAGSWRWQARPESFTRALAARLREVTAEAGRLAG